MFKPSNLSAFFLALCASGLALNASAQSVDLKVTGTITPAACLPTIAGGGTVDFGKINASDLNQTSPTSFSEHRGFQIACDAATKVAIKITDNRSDSRVVGIVPGAPAVPEVHFGLGKAGTTNIGSYVIGLPMLENTADGNPADILKSEDGGSTWTAYGISGNILAKNSTVGLYSWASRGGVQPIALENLSTTLVVLAAVDRGSNLPLGDEITLDGSATIELVYL